MFNVTDQHTPIPMSKGATVGIDLGTTNSVVSHYTDHGPMIVKNAVGERTTPSVVGFQDDEGILVGKAAKNIAEVQPNRVVESVKRLMGEEEPLSVATEQYRPEEISALILKKLIQDSEETLETDITNAVVTVPAYFNNRQREATIQAGKLAGITVDRIINEPTAACLAYGHPNARSELVLVYDLGGGTFDVSLVDISDGVFKVVATDGLKHHGGDDWDSRIVGQIISIFENETGIDQSDDRQAMQRAWEAAREAKEDLCTREQTKINMPFFGADDDGPLNFESVLTRTTFQEMTRDLLEETIDVCESVLSEADVRPEEIDNVLLVGGSTRMPQIEERLRDTFGDNVSKRANPDEVVAKGASIQAAKLHGSINALPDGTTDIVPRQTEKPTSHTLSALEDIVLVDVTSRTLGVEVQKGGNGGFFKPIIDRNTPIPANGVGGGVTVHDNQTRIRISVYQGEQERVEDNDFLGECHIEGVPPRPAGEVSVEVEFSIDQNGTLDVEAFDDFDNSASVQIESGIEFSQQELEERRSNLPKVK